MVRFPLIVTLVLGLVFGAMGCKGTGPQSHDPATEGPSAKPRVGDRKTPSQPPDSTWGGEKIGELAPPPKDRPPAPQFLVTAALDVYVLELPADNVDKLEAIWQTLSAAPIRLSSYNAFSENSFRLLFGRIEIWGKIQELLAQADAQPVTTVTLTLGENDKTDLPISEVPVARPIAFIGNDLTKQTANVGPGILALRLVAEPNPWVRGARKIIGYPVHTLPVAGTIPELQARAQQHEFYFSSAAFACQMRPGDLLVLGPEKYTGERATLGGLFFNNPQESLFFNASKQKPPERRLAVRVYILVCTQVRG